MSARDEIEAVDQAYEKAVSNRDVAGILDLYTNDAFLLPPNAPVAKGRSAIQAVLQGYFDAGAQALELDTIAHEETGEAAIEVGTYTLTIQPPGADPITDEGKYLQVFKRQADGTYRIAYDAFSSNEPPPA